MKILAICQYYYPEPFKVHEICEELVKRGNDVTVITGRPNYPDGSLYQGYENRMHENINGVNVIRTNIALRGKNSLSLIRNYFSFPRKGKKVVRKLNDDFDVVYVYQLSPVMMLKPAIYYKNKYNKRLVVYCLDLWPESLKAIHIKESNPIFKLVHKMSNKLYSECDNICVTTPEFKSYLIEKNKVDISKLCLNYQHGENLFLKVKPYEEQEKLTLTFAGNIGKVQDFDCLVKAVNLLNKEELLKLRIIIIGSGSYSDQFKKMVKDVGLECVFEFFGQKNKEDLIEYFNQTSLFLLSLEKGNSLSNTIPSKLQTYMATGRGIIGTINGPAREIIEKANAGNVCDAGNYEILSGIMRENLKDGKMIKTYSENSRKFYCENFTLNKHIDKLLELLEDKQ